MTFLDEVLEQPAALKHTLAHLRQADLIGTLKPVRDRLRDGRLSRVIFSGMGSSFAAGYPGVIRLNRRGIPAFSVNAAELLHYRLGLLGTETLLLLVSQSGESVETIRLAEAWKRRGMLISLTNEADNTLSRMADLALQFQAGPEEAVSSKTYTCTLGALTLLTATLVGETPENIFARLEECVAAMSNYLADWETLANSLLDTLAIEKNLILLGRGPSIASAMTGALILKESVRIYAEGMNAAEFRHGPLEVSDSDWPAILFIPDTGTTHLMMRLATQMLDNGSPLAVIGPHCNDARAFHLPLPTLDELISPMVEIVPIHTLAYLLGKRSGQEVGTFRYIGKVTHTQ